ncbi:MULTISPECIES: phosphatase PAP2 family protein [Altibacter]|uniref:phosphatase PAP2 family protein n=1 Tax=Altibacter TaxID=1535231 RepID=UPI000557A461|nr:MULTISPECIES: phosphatase PAP2 family protein [Altibacter]MCW8980550.1 phosphatase PAP2 family protein [Altibacter sp.]MCW9036876.1 phosphatase PAP2 family protein [Altibacter sp.]
MKKTTILAITIIMALATQFRSFAQENGSPYELDWTTDAIWTGLGLAGSAGGLLIIQNKDDLTLEEFNNLNIDDINGIDRWAAGNHSESASKLSDIPFAFSFGSPFLLLFDDEINDHTGQIAVLYIETLATTATMYSFTAGLIDRSRPYVYDDSGDTSMSRRLSNNGQRSFYAGHVAASATATFFAAKVYSDFNPDAAGKAWVWAGAATVPAVVAYLRIEAGQHFLTDVTLGYVLGAATGILVPELHKKKNDNLSVYPSVGRNNMTGDAYRGMALRLTF